jgi:hypothetical protein
MRPIARGDYHLDATCRGDVLITTLEGTGSLKASLHAALYMAEQIRENSLAWGALKVISPQGAITWTERYQMAQDISAILRRHAWGGAAGPQPVPYRSQIFCIGLHKLWLTHKGVSSGKRR